MDFATLLGFSLLAGLLISWPFRWLTNADKIRFTKDQMTAHILGVRLFRDQVPVALASYASAGLAAGKYIWLMLPAAAVAALPFAFIYGQLQARLDRTAPRPGEPLLLTVRLRPQAVSDDVHLELPRSLRLTAPPVHAISSNEITWRIQPTACGVFNATIVIGGSRVIMPVRACDAIQRLTVSAEPASWITRLFEPDLENLPPASPAERITVGYAERRLSAAGHDLDWRLLFFVLVAVFAVLLKPVTGASF